jgi:uncharacterized membrane protein YjjB (DUF3815 family)
VFIIPRKCLIASGFVGMLGWTVFVTLTVNMNIKPYPWHFSSRLHCATPVKLGQVLKMPVTVFSISGVIPLVPGGKAYETIRLLSRTTTRKEVRLGTITLLIAGSIAFGLIFSGVITECFSRKKRIPKGIYSSIRIFSVIVWGLVTRSVEIETPMCKI